MLFRSEGSGERGDAAVLKTNLVAGEGDGIIDAEFISESLDGVGIVVVNHQTENLKAILVFVLKIDEVGNFRTARSAPGSPEVQKNDFAAGAGEGKRFSIESGQLEIRREIGVADEADGGLLFLGRRGWRKEAQKQ